MKLPQGRHLRGGRAGRAAPALLRVRPGRVDRLGGPPLRHRRRRAAPPPAQADPLRLHHPQPAQGRRRCRPTTTRWRSGSPGSQAEEDLARVRPDLDGNAIMELLGVPPGPIVGQAWRFLKELRLDRGPLDRDEAEAELLRWAREHGHIPDRILSYPPGQNRRMRSWWTPRSARSASSSTATPWSACDSARRHGARRGRASGGCASSRPISPATLTGLHRAGRDARRVGVRAGGLGARSPRSRMARCVTYGADRQRPG